MQAAAFSNLGEGGGFLGADGNWHKGYRAENLSLYRIKAKIGRFLMKIPRFYSLKSGKNAIFFVEFVKFNNYPPPKLKIFIIFAAVRQ